MKKIFSLIPILLIVSCDADWVFDDKSTDTDDINLIDKVWKQWLDKAIEMYDTKSRAS